LSFLFLWLSKRIWLIFVFNWIILNNLIKCLYKMPLDLLIRMNIIKLLTLASTFSYLTFATLNTNNFLIFLNQIFHRYIIWAIKYEVFIPLKVLILLNDINSLNILPQNINIWRVNLGNIKIFKFRKKLIIKQLLKFIILIHSRMILLSLLFSIDLTMVI